MVTVNWLSSAGLLRGEAIVRSRLQISKSLSDGIHREIGSGWGRRLIETTHAIGDRSSRCRLVTVRVANVKDVIANIELE